MTDLEIQEQDQETKRKKYFLKRYRKNRSLIVRLKCKVENLDERITGIRSPGFSDMPRGGTPITKEDMIAEKCEIEERIKRLEAKGKKLKVEILEKIDELEEPQYAEVLESFFIDCKDLGDIAEENCYSIRHTIRLYSKAIKAISVD